MASVPGYKADGATPSACVGSCSSWHHWWAGLFVLLAMAKTRPERRKVQRRRKMVWVSDAITRARTQNVSKDQIAIIALAVTLVSTIFGAGWKIGTLSTEIELQSKEISLLRADLSALNQYLIAHAR